jgi:uncharacterized phiE125 gp8 family phage protein
MPWAWKYKTTAPAPPVLLQEAKEHLRVTHDDEDLLIISKLASAVRKCEEFCHRQFGRTQLVLVLDRFPTGRKPLFLPRPPLVSVDSIAYVDPENVTRLFVDPAIDTASEPGRIQPEVGLVWPVVRDVIGAVQIEYTAGYTESTLPSLLRDAVLLQLGSLYEHREDIVVGTISSKLAMGVEDLLMPFKVGDEFTCYGPEARYSAQ